MSEKGGRVTALTRRKLLKRAGIYGAALGIAGMVKTADQLGARSVSEPKFPYLTGFNDDFVSYSKSGFASATLDRVKSCAGRCIRFPVDWGDVQQESRTSFNWSSYDPIFGQALAAGVQLLPVILGCPEWANPVVTAARRDDLDPPYPADIYRTCSPSFDFAFADFVDQTLRHFDFFSKQHGYPTVVSGAEILNEPNLWSFGAVPAARVFQLTSASAAKVAASQAAGAYSGKMRVISGGPAPVLGIGPDNPKGHPPRPSWQRYLGDLVKSGPVNFDVGFHSYETSKPPDEILTIPEDNPSDPFARAREFANWQASRIVARFDEASTITSRDIWLTETGASSACIWSSDIFSSSYRAAHGPSIQAAVLAGIADSLKSRPRCRSMFVHRLYSDNLLEPPPTPASNSNHYQDGIYDSVNGNPKVAPFVLAERWS